MDNNLISNFSQIIVADLEKKVQKLQEDLTLSYKRNSDNATTMLELNQHVKVLEEDLKNKDVEYVSISFGNLYRPESKIGRQDYQKVSNTSKNLRMTCKKKT